MSESFSTPPYLQVLAPLQLAHEDCERHEDIAALAGVGARGGTEDAAAALGELLDAGFINVEQEVEGGRTVLVLDAGDQQKRAREILTAHGGLEFDSPS